VVRGTFSPARAWRPAVGPASPPTLGLMKHIALASFLAILLTVAVATVAASWWFRPALRIEMLRGAAVIHTELMGEYPTNLESIELREEKSDKIVWRAVAEGKMFQMHSVALSIGENDTQPSVYWGKLHAIKPAESSSFVLVSNTPYLVRVCSSFYISLCNSGVFAWSAR